LIPAIALVAGEPLMLAAKLCCEPEDCLNI